MELWSKLQANKKCMCDPVDLVDNKDLVIIIYANNVVEDCWIEVKVFSVFNDHANRKDSHAVVYVFNNHANRKDSHA